MRLPNIKIVTASGEMTFGPEQVEDFVPGRRGRVTLRGGPTLHGDAVELAPGSSRPLGMWQVPPPPGKTERALEARRSMGLALMDIARQFEKPDPWGS